jgi:hypothetical protein
MTKLFNKARQKLLVENKIWPYLKYALGEIVLVVIGILLALQINNWNENKKDRETEIYILNEVLSNLNEDGTVIESIVTRREKARRSTDKMLTYLPKGKINKDTLAADLVDFITFDRYFPINIAFEILKTKGLKLSNNQLTSRISRYYDFEQKWIERSIADIEDQIKPLLLNMTGIRRFLPTIILSKSVTISNADDRVFLKELYDELNNFKDNNMGTLEKLIKFREMNASLIHDIEIELTRLRNQ